MNSNLDQIFYEALGHALARGDIKENEIQSVAAEVLKTITPQAATDLVKGLKRRTPKLLRRQKALDAGFVRRNYRRWKRPLDLLEMLWRISEEVGGAFNHNERPAAVKTNDYQFEALVSVHARALLVSREVLCLLYGGYPDGALSRWRSLHELAVTALFLQMQDQETSHRYLASFPFASYRAARQFNQHAERARIIPISEAEVVGMKQRCEAFAKRFGDEMYEEYGWASRALNNPKPNFAQIEKAISLDHWRPRYRWASQHTHGGYRPPLALLGTKESMQLIHLVGQSNSGFTDPIHMTALSLNQVTCAMLVTRPTLDNIIFMRVAQDLGDEIGDVAAEVEKRTLEQARARERQQKPKKKAIARKRPVKIRP